MLPRSRLNASSAETLLNLAVMLTVVPGSILTCHPVSAEIFPRSLGRSQFLMSTATPFLFVLQISESAPGAAEASRMAATKTALNDKPLNLDIATSKLAEKREMQNAK